MTLRRQTISHDEARNALLMRIAVCGCCSHRDPLPDRQPVAVSPTARMPVGRARRARDSKARIGAVLPTFSHPFFLAQKRGLEEKAKELGVEIDVRDGQDDDVKQISQVETLINLGCKAMILCPRDEDALVPAVEAANRAGVPVIALNRRINGGNVLAYVGADDAEGGMHPGASPRRSARPQGGQDHLPRRDGGLQPPAEAERGVARRAQEASGDRHRRPPVRRVPGGQGQGRDDRPGPPVLAGRDSRRGRPVGRDGRSRRRGRQGGGMEETSWSSASTAAAPPSTPSATGGSRPRSSRTRWSKARRPSRRWRSHLQGKKPDPEVVTPLRLITRSNVDRFEPAY